MLFVSPISAENTITAYEYNNANTNTFFIDARNMIHFYYVEDLENTHIVVSILDVATGEYLTSKTFECKPMDSVFECKQITDAYFSFPVGANELAIINKNLEIIKVLHLPSYRYKIDQKNNIWDYSVSEDLFKIIYLITDGEAKKMLQIYDIHSGECILTKTAEANKYFLDAAFLNKSNVVVFSSESIYPDQYLIINVETGEQTNIALDYSRYKGIAYFEGITKSKNSLIIGVINPPAPSNDAYSREYVQVNSIDKELQIQEKQLPFYCNLIMGDIPSNYLAVMTGTDDFYMLYIVDENGNIINQVESFALIPPTNSIDTRMIKIAPNGTVYAQSTIYKLDGNSVSINLHEMESIADHIVATGNRIKKYTKFQY